MYKMFKKFMFDFLISLAIFVFVEKILMIFYPSASFLHRLVAFIILSTFIKNLQVFKNIKNKI